MDLLRTYLRSYFLENTTDHMNDFVIAKGRLESKLKFSDKEAFKGLKDGRRSNRQMNVRLEELHKEIRGTRTCGTAVNI